MQPFKPYPTLVALTAVALFSTLPAQAQPAADAAKPADLKAVLVSVSRSQAQVEAMPLNTTIVSQEDIQRSAAQTLDQLLRDIPGLNFTGVPAAQSDPTGHQTKMRGMGNAKVLVLLDGVPIHDPFYLTTQWFKVPLSTIERVEVVRGGNSSLWGNMAVAGVINIVSKRPVENSGEATLNVGSNGSVSAAVSKNIVLSDTLSVNLALDKLNSRGYDTVLPEHLWRYPARQPVNTQDTNFQFTTFFKPSATLNGYVRIGQHIQDQDISYVYGKNLQIDPDISASLTRTLDDKSTLSATGWAQYLEFEKYNGATCYWKTACTSTTKTTDTSASITPNVVSYYTQYGSQRYREQGASAIYSKSMAGWLNSLQVGVDYRHLSASDVETFFAAPTSLSKLQNPSSSTYGKAEQTFNGVFAQTKIVANDALDITFSARFDSWDNTDRVNTRTMAGAAPVGGAQASSNTNAFNPSIAARYALHDDLAVRGAAYKSFRAPGFNNTTRTFGSPNPTIANPDLTPENLLGREIGVDYNRGDVSVSATYFQYDIQNMIASYKVADYATAPALVQLICGVNLMNCGGTPASGATALKQGSANFYSNDQDGQSYGLELQAAWKLNSQWALDGSYTRTTSMLTRKGFVGGEPVGVQTTGVPQDVASLGANWRPNAAWQSHVQVRYIGSMNIDTTSTAGVEYKQGDTTVWDASLQYRFSKDLDLSASVVNLLDTQYSENAYTYNQPWSRTLSMPRTVTLGLKMRF
jgi:iron complex outermembrane receptor protein